MSFFQYFKMCLARRPYWYFMLYLCIPSFYTFFKEDMWFLGAMILGMGSLMLPASLYLSEKKWLHK